MKNRRYLGMLVLLILAMLIVACSPVTLPGIRYYSLAPTHLFVQSHKHRSSSVLYLATPISNPGYETTNMLYVTEPYQLSAFGQSQWVSPPALMLQAMVADALRSKGFYRAVITHAQGAQWQYRLNLTLAKLQQEFIGPQSHVRLEILVTLVDVGHGGQVLASQRFTALERAYAANPYAGVLAANRAATRLSSEIARFCIKKTQS